MNKSYETLKSELKMELARREHLALLDSIGISLETSSAKTRRIGEHGDQLPLLVWKGLHLVLSRKFQDGMFPGRVHLHNGSEILCENGPGQSIPDWDYVWHVIGFGSARNLQFRNLRRWGLCSHCKAEARTNETRTKTQNAENLVFDSTDRLNERQTFDCFSPRGAEGSE
tara:strand:- start:78 stop:587 length:510 start_codon:yes stop_codon:yes gene_type:complete